MKPSDMLRWDLYTGDDAETVSEISGKTFKSGSTVREHAKKLVEAGVWKEVLVKRPGKRHTEKAFICVEK